MKNSWQKIKLGDACTLIKGVTYKSEDYASIDDGLVFLTLKSIAKGGGFNFDGVKYYKGETHDDQFVTPNDLIIANTDLTRAGDVIGAPLFVPQIDKENKYVYSMDITKIVTDESKLNRNYLYHYLLTNNVRNYMRGISNGSTVLHLKVNLVNKLDIPLPSLEIQAKIVQILSGIDAEIRYTNQIIQKTEVLKHGLMQKVLAQGKKIHIKDIAVVKRGASPRPIGDPSYFANTGRGWIRIADVTSTYKYLNKTSQYLSKSGEDASVKVDPGDLIMSICATVGKPVFVSIPACIHDGFVLFRNIDKTVIDPEFFFYALLHNEGQLRSKGQTGSQMNLNSTIVENTEIQIPELAKQKEIANILKSIDQKLDFYSQELERLQTIKKGLMQDIFCQKVQIN